MVVSALKLITVCTHLVLTALLSAVVAGDYLYIDGGEMAVGASATSNLYSQYILNQTLSIDLSVNFTPSTVQINVVPKPASVPTTNFEALWYSEGDNAIYAFGGESSHLSPVDGTPYDLGIWKFTPDGGGNGTWSQNTTSRDIPFSTGLTRPLGGAFTTGNNTAWYLGGYSSSSSSPQTEDLNSFVPAPGLTSYDFQHGLWSNDSASGFDQYGTAQWGGIEFVPDLGPNGLLFMWGGDTSNASVYKVGVDQRLMDNITAYDPHSKIWYHQNASGDPLPSSRQRFCFVSAHEDGTNSTEIFMYGGYNGTLGTEAKDFDEVWILTLPAFHWIPGPKGSTARMGHTCNVVGGRQMLYVGGVDPSEPSLASAWNHSDNTDNSIGIFDLTLGKFNGSYNPNGAAYQRPDVVATYYQQNGAYPGIWTQSSLQSLIQNPEKNTTNTTNVTLPNVPPPKTSHSNTGAIVGGVVGGVAGLVVLALAAFFLLRRRRTKNRSSQSAPQDYALAAPESPKEQVTMMPLHEMPNNALGSEGPKEMIKTKSFHEMPSEASRLEMEAENVRHEMPAT